MRFRDRERERMHIISIMDAYLYAFSNRDFRSVKFSPEFRNTCNGVSVPLGSALSRTVQSIRKGGQYFVDVDTGQIEYWGVIDEMGKDAIYGVRLRVEGTLISEVETLGVRNTDPYYFPEVLLTLDRGFHDAIATEERASRQELVACANGYFDAIEQQDGSLASVEEECRRFVNGAEDSLAHVSALGASQAFRQHTVQSQISKGHYAYIEGVRERRFPIVDTERGIALSHVLFDHPGDLPRANGEIPFGYPNTMIAFEAFKIRSGIITDIWAICYSVVYGSWSGWTK